MTRTIFAWRNVARILASERDVQLLQDLGIEQPRGDTRSWARALLDATEDFYEVYEVEPDGGREARELETYLAALAGPASMAGLTSAADVLSASFDDRENRSFWEMLLDTVWRNSGERSTPQGRCR